MAVIEVREAGLFTTVQDLGREGFGAMGVSPSGAADAVSLRVGNRLVGNAAGAAGLEMTLLGGTFAFPDGAVVALAGSDFGATLDGKPAELWATFEMKPGQVLKMGPTRTGARCYLCVQGGIEVDLFLGSASTHILSGLGGFEGRALRKGDALRTGVASGSARKRGVSVRALKEIQPRRVLRVTPGPQSEWFPEAARRLFFAGRYVVAEESNRMGIRLKSEAVLETPVGKMISEGVSLGAIQVPEGGEPIILFVEQQTTGGYPKIANVISADFHSLGQLRPRDEVRFERVDWDTARNLLREQEELLASEALFE
jgi:antagonist of KipI